MQGTSPWSCWVLVRVSELTSAQCGNYGFSYPIQQLHHPLDSLLDEKMVLTTWAANALYPQGRKSGYSLTAACGIVLSRFRGPAEEQAYSSVLVSGMPGCAAATLLHTGPSGWRHLSITDPGVGDGWLWSIPHQLWHLDFSGNFASTPWDHVITCWVTEIWANVL